MDWTAVLRQARTVAEVLEVMDEFLSSCSDVYWHSVPESLRRPVIVTNTDLERWHHQLVKHLADTPVPGKPLQELARISLHAVARVHQVRLGIVPKGSPNDEGGYSAAPGEGDTKRCA